MKRLMFVIGSALVAFALMSGVANASLLGPTWNHTPGHAPYVMVEDHTGAAWPVHAATNAWAYGLHYGRCVNSQCVRVYEYNGARDGIVGQTRYSYYSNNRFAVVAIYMNNAYAGLSYSYRLQAATHELGHSLGLGHDGYRDVMYYALCGCDVISAYERNELTNIYHT